MYQPRYMSETEHKILRKLLSAARLGGFAPAKVDLGSNDFEATNSDDEVVEAVDAVESADIQFANLQGSFWVGVILGNETDFISDYTIAPDIDAQIEEIMNSVQEYAQSLE